MIKRISKAINRIPLEFRILSYGVFVCILLQYLNLIQTYYEGVMIVFIIAIYLFVSLGYEIPTVTISLFVDEEHIDKMERTVIPSVGDTIVIDCGNLVKVVDINHDWSTPDLVQINCISVKGEE